MCVRKLERKFLLANQSWAVVVSEIVSGGEGEGISAGSGVEGETDLLIS